jgi:phosphatidylserine decarboxylase
MDPFSFLFWRLHWFFRDPVRTPPSGRVIVSPADGVVLYVRRIERGEVPNPVKRGVPIPLEEWVGRVACESAGWLVGVYMTPLSVHYNRAPVPGRITQVVPRAAKQRNLSMTRPFMRLLWGMPPFEADSRYLTENARNTIVIEGEVRAVVVQIADAYVREVDCFVQAQQSVLLGEKIGMIRMGSQCDLFLADRPDLQLDCHAGQRVYAGETIIGRY